MLQAGSGGHPRGGGTQFGGVRVSRSEDALGERVRREQDGGALGQRGERALHLGTEKAHVGGIACPRIDGSHVAAGGLERRAQAVLVLADRERRVVRGEDETDDRADPAGGHFGCSLLDHRVRMLEAEHHFEPAGLTGLEGSRKGGALRLGECRQR